MADWRLAMKKVLKSERPRKFRHPAAVKGPDHRSASHGKGGFPADELLGFDPGLTRINSPAGTRMDAGVREDVWIDPFFPVSPGASIKADHKILPPTYGGLSSHDGFGLGEIPLSYVSTHRDKPEKRDKTLAGPAGDDPAAWVAWMRSRIPVWVVRGQSVAEASDNVWSEAEDIWHRRHGSQPDPDRCAGCGRRMLDAPGMSLLDGAVVHVGFDCLIAHGVQWRQAASNALVALLEEQAAIAEFVGGQAHAAAERQAWTEMIGKPDGAAR